MNRSVMLAAALVALVGPISDVSAAYRSALIPQSVARVHGIERAWFSQVQIDPGRGRLVHLVLYDDALYAASDRAVVQALDAETGATLWTRVVGKVGYPTLRPSVNRDFLGIVNGAQLFVMNRHTGELLIEKKLPGSPGAGPALSTTRAYVPMTDGRVFSYSILPEKDAAEELGKKSAAPVEPISAEVTRAQEQERREGARISLEFSMPLVTQGVGGIMVPPIVTRQDENGDFVGWTTDRSYLFVAHVNLLSGEVFEPRYRVETSGEVVAPLTSLPAHESLVPDTGILYAGTMNGYVYALQERNGTTLWRFSAGEAIVEPCVPVGQRVFVPTQLGGMFCLDAVSGIQRWFANGVSQVVAVSATRVYAADRVGRLRVIDLEHGALLDTIDTSASPIHVANVDNDRIYVATRDGLIQCFHEVELDKPLVHQLKPAEAKVAKPAPKPQATQPEPAAGDDPFATGDDPFAAGAAEPAAGADADAGDDPFAPAAGGAEEDPFAPAAGDAMEGGDVDDPFR